MKIHRVGILSLLLAGISGLGPKAKGAPLEPSVEPQSTGIAVQVAPQSTRSDEVTLLWNRPTEAIAGGSYEVLRDDELVGTTTKMFFTVKGLLPAHDYSFRIGAKSAAGLRVASSQRLMVRTAAAEKILSVVDFGAVGDGKTMNTRAIQAAIDACPANGTVMIPKGTFLSGALFLKSDMHFEVAKDGVLQGSVAAADYEPLYLNRFEGWELETYASLINAGKLDHTGPANVRNISIRGEGKIVGGGNALANEMIAKRGLRGRGRLICVMNCHNLEVEGVTLEQPPSWTIHYIYSDEVSIHGVTLRTASTRHNGDGIDPDSSRNSYIFNCTFDTGDDCIAIKSGKNPEGNVINRPTENVRIFGCVFAGGHGISIGSEISGGVRGVLVEDCIAGNLIYGMQIKGTRDRGAIVEDVVVRDCELQKISILTQLGYNNDGAPAPTPPVFQNFRFENIDLTNAKPGAAIIIEGYPEKANRTRGLVFENIRLPDDAIIKVDQAENVRFTNVTTKSGRPPIFEVKRSEGITH